MVECTYIVGNHYHDEINTSITSHAIFYDADM